MPHAYWHLNNFTGHLCRYRSITYPLSLSLCLSVPLAASFAQSDDIRMLNCYTFNRFQKTMSCQWCASAINESLLPPEMNRFCLSVIFYSQNSFYSSNAKQNIFFLSFFRSVLVSFGEQIKIETKTMTVNGEAELYARAPWMLLFGCCHSIAAEIDLNIFSLLLLSFYSCLNDRIERYIRMRVTLWIGVCARGLGLLDWYSYITYFVDLSVDVNGFAVNHKNAYTFMVPNAFEREMLFVSFPFYRCANGKWTGKWWKQ